MASITHDASGRRIVQFFGVDGKRHSVRIGKVGQRDAEGFKRRIEILLSAQIGGHVVDAETARWLASLPSPLHQRLAKVGLTETRAEATLKPFITGYVDGRVDVKPATKEVWRQGEMGLVDFFDAERPLRQITAGEADQYKQHLIAARLAPMTILKRLRFAKTIFRAAMRHRLTDSNPFADVSIRAVTLAKLRFITREETAKLLAACPDHHWRAIIGLARYGGLRCPSEVLSLRWQDLDWDGGRVTVHSPKTEHHPGKATRLIPLFAALRPILDEARELAEEGATYVVDARYRSAAMGPSGWRNCNLRTKFKRIVRRAGLTPWPRLFHNLRSSCETELTQDFPLPVVISWLGHSADVALKHYCQVTDGDFERAAKALRNVVQSPPTVTVDEVSRPATPQEQIPGNSRSGEDGHAANGHRELAESALQKAVQQLHETAREVSQPKTRNRQKHRNFPGIAGARDSSRNDVADGEGFEPPGPCGPPVFKTGAIGHSATRPDFSVTLKIAWIGSFPASRTTRFFLPIALMRPKHALIWRETRTRSRPLNYPRLAAGQAFSSFDGTRDAKPEHRRGRA